MKKAIILIFPIIFFFVSCEKEKAELFALSGKWKLVSTCGGVVGCITANDNNVTTIEFKDNVITEQVKDSQASPSTYYKNSNYTIVDITYEDSKASYEVKLEDGTMYVIDVFADHLVLSDNLLWKTYNKL